MKQDKTPTTPQEGKGLHTPERPEFVKDFEGNDVNVKNFISSLHNWPSFARKVMGEDGIATLTNCAFAEPKCGCKITGNGTLQFPMQIQFCETHSQAPTLKAERDKLVGCLETIYSILSNWNEARDDNKYANILQFIENATRKQD